MVIGKVAAIYPSWGRTARILATAFADDAPDGPHITLIFLALVTARQCDEA
jgi:hypothetical protein